MAAGTRLEVGRIGRPHGLRGEVLVSLVTNRTERLAPGAVLGSDKGDIKVVTSRPHQGRWIVSLAGVDDREGAEALRGTVLTAEAVEDAGALWVHELIGRPVVGVDDRSYGEVTGVEANPASDLLVLEGGGLVPLVFVVEHGPAGVVVDVPDGLVEPQPEPVVLVPYDPAWPARFEEEAGLLRAALGEVAQRIDHVGSTAVPGLAAKPVIDVQVSVATLVPAEPYRRPLEALGYVFVPDPQAPDYPFFRKQTDGRRSHHIHVARAGSREERRHLVFRDHLRADRSAAARYTALKHELAERLGDDRLAYSEAKAAFVREVETATGV